MMRNVLVNKAEIGITAARYLTLCYVANSIRMKLIDDIIENIHKFNCESLGNIDELQASLNSKISSRKSGFWHSNFSGLDSLAYHRRHKSMMKYVWNLQCSYLYNFRQKISSVRSSLYSIARDPRLSFSQKFLSGETWGKGYPTSDLRFFGLAKNISIEEFSAPPGYRSAMRDSLDNFFLKKNPFDPTNVLIYADHLEESGCLSRAKSLRKNSEDLAKFAGRFGMRIESKKPSLEVCRGMVRNFSDSKGRLHLSNCVEEYIRGAES